MSRLSPKPCPVPGCWQLQPCPVHARKAWAGMGHGERLGINGWERQRRNDRTLRKHRRICHVCGQPGADKIDHVIPLSQGGGDDEGNRRPIHSEPCHRLKTEREKAAGRQGGTSTARRPDPPPRRRGVASIPLDAGDEP